MALRQSSRKLRFILFFATNFCFVFASLAVHVDKTNKTMKENKTHKEMKDKKTNKEINKMKDKKTNKRKKYKQTI